MIILLGYQNADINVPDYKNQLICNYEEGWRARINALPFLIDL